MVFLNTVYKVYIYFLEKARSYLNSCAHYLPPTVFSFKDVYKQPWLTCVTVLIIHELRFKTINIWTYVKNVSIEVCALSSVRFSRHLGRVVWLYNNIIISNCVGGEWWPRGSRWQKAGNLDDESDTQKGFLQGFVRSPWPFSVESALPIL